MIMLGLTRSLALAPFGPKDAVRGVDVGTGHDSVAPWSEHVVALRSPSEVAL